MNATQVVNTLFSTTSTSSDSTPQLNPDFVKKVFTNVPPKTFKRNEFGLLEEVNYIFNEDGTVNWRAMIPRQFLYINKSAKDRIEKRYSKKIEDIDVISDNVDDSFLVIKLAGLKFLAFLRGFSSVSYQPVCANPNYASTACDVAWIENYETNNQCVYFGGLGSAMIENTNKMTSSYLIEMSENRAFCRAVRSFLRINIVSQEELKPDGSPQIEEEESVSKVDPYSLLQQNLDKRGITFKMVKGTLLKKATTDEEKALVNSYNSIQDIKTNIIFDILGKLQKKDEQKVSKENPIPA